MIVTSPISPSNTTNNKKIRFGKNRMDCSCCTPNRKDDEMDETHNQGTMYPFGDEIVEPEDFSQDVEPPPPLPPANPDGDIDGNWGRPPRQ